MMRLLALAARSMVWRSWFMQAERPISVLDDGASCFNSFTSRFSRDVSSARVATRMRRSDLNGFSMKS